MAIEIISAATALVAVIVGPLVTLRIAKRQIHASVVSPNRQAWINSLRDCLAEFLTCCMLWEAIAVTKELGGLGERDMTDTWRTAVLHMNRVVLLLNPNEEDHVALKSLMKESLGLLADDDMEAFRHRLSGINSASQAILKAEWERVKRGD